MIRTLLTALLPGADASRAVVALPGRQPVALAAALAHFEARLAALEGRRDDF